MLRAVRFALIVALCGWVAACAKDTKDEASAGKGGSGGDSGIDAASGSGGSGGVGGTTPQMDAGEMDAGRDAAVDAGDDAETPEPVSKTEVMPLIDGEAFYPRAILRANGTILVSVVSPQTSGRLGATILESTDDGVTFEKVGNIDDRNTDGFCCGTIYELPQALGALPANALLWSASVGWEATTPASIPVWSSTDDGRTWDYLSTVYTAPTGEFGLWEPEFWQLDDGRLVCHWSDETDRPAHSQKLVQAISSDGLTWGAPIDTVALTFFDERPGMPNVRRGGPDDRLILNYEICGPTYGCSTFFRTSADGLDWGDATQAGSQPVTLEGKHFRHAPTLTQSDAPGANGRLFLVGQIVHEDDGDIAPENGNIVLVNTEHGSGAWYPVPAPVPIEDPYDNFCPNYSSTLLPLHDGTVGLEVASRYDGGGCRSYFALGPLVEPTDGSEITDGTTYELVNLVSGKCMDVENGSAAAGANVQQWDCNDSAAQQFTVERDADSNISLVAQTGGGCVTAAGGSNTAGANVEQQPCDQSVSQAWTLRSIGTGYYELRHVGSRSCLDIADGSNTDGANVQQWTCNDLAPQIWRFDIP